MILIMRSKLGHCRYYIVMSALEKVFGRTAQMIVLENLIEHQNESTYLSGIAEETGLSHSSVARVIDPLLDADIVIEKRLGKQIRTFRLNMDNKTTKLILDFHTRLNKELK
jgi:DNA-binding transcriptional ArsR family regulator